MRSLPSIILIAWAWICGLISLAHAGADTSMPAGSTLYAYGDGINGLPVFYADGKLEGNHTSPSHTAYTCSFVCLYLNKS